MSMLLGSVLKGPCFHRMESVKLMQYRSNLQYSVYLPYVFFWLASLCHLCRPPLPCRCRCCCCWCSSDTVFCRWRSIGSAAWPKPPGGSWWGSCSSPAVEGDRKCSSDTANGKEGNRHNTNTKTSTWLYNWGWGFSRSQWERPRGHCDRESKSWSGCCTCGKNEKKVEVVVVVVILVQVFRYCLCG